MPKTMLQLFVVLCITITLTTTFSIVYAWFYSDTRYAIRVGILHSQTGTMALSELPLVDATLLAIEEINNRGGLLGKSIEPIIADGASDPTTFANQAEKLIKENKVDVIFGCWTSASRKAVKPVVEKYNNLLFYPLQYEGLESSANIIYTGAAPNQQILPGVAWCYYNLGKTFYLIGSDYVFPRTANVLIKDYVAIYNITIVGEVYQPLSSMEFADIVQDIVKKQPKVIINTLNGSSNIAFFTELKKAGITADTIPVMSFSVAEEELQAGLDPKDLAGNYATWNYFQSINRPENAHFVEQFKDKYGKDRVVSDPLEAAYFGIYLWAQTVSDAGTSATSTIKKMIKGQGRNAPEGIVYIDQDNNHTWKTVRIGKITTDGQFDIVWDSTKAIRPIPFPTFGTQNWTGFLERLYQGWNKKWAVE